MISHRERRAAALEAIANALLDLAAIEREPEGAQPPPADVLITRKNAKAELGLSGDAFANAAGRDFPAFRVGKKITATKADVLAWLKTLAVAPKPSRTVTPGPSAPLDADDFVKAADACFKKRTGRVMTDMELNDAETLLQVWRDYARMTGATFNDSPDDAAARIQAKIGQESRNAREWRAVGLDPSVMERDADALLEKLRTTRPDMGWRERVQAVYEMWEAIDGPLFEARRAKRAAARAAKKAERAQTRAKD